MNTNSFVMSFVSRVVLVIFVSLLIPALAFSADRLVVENSGGTATFVVEDNGNVYTAAYYDAQGSCPGFWLDEAGAGHKGAFFVLDNSWMQLQRREQGFGSYEASVEMVSIHAPAYSLVIESDGDVGFGLRWPSHPLHMKNGAYCSAGGVWTNTSSREYKKDIKELGTNEAVDTLKGLNPVKFSYKANSDERHVGFIAEDVPELVASKDRKGMSSMDVVAVLTKVMQEQQRIVQEQRATIAELSKRLAQVENIIQSR
jgi:hypothetical protein